MLIHIGITVSVARMMYVIVSLDIVADQPRLLCFWWPTTS